MLAARLFTMTLRVGPVDPSTPPPTGLASSCRSSASSVLKASSRPSATELRSAPTNAPVSAVGDGLRSTAALPTWTRRRSRAEASLSVGKRRWASCITKVAVVASGELRPVRQRERSYGADQVTERDGIGGENPVRPLAELATPQLEPDCGGVRKVRTEAGVAPQGRVIAVEGSKVRPEVDRK